MATYFYEHRQSPDESILEMIERDDIKYGESFIGMIIQEDSIQRKMKSLIYDNIYSLDLSDSSLKDEFEAMDREVIHLRERISERIEEISYSLYED